MSPIPNFILHSHPLTRDPLTPFSPPPTPHAFRASTINPAALAPPSSPLPHFPLLFWAFTSPLPFQLFKQKLSPTGPILCRSSYQSPVVSYVSPRTSRYPALPSFLPPTPHFSASTVPVPFQYTLFYLLHVAFGAEKNQARLLKRNLDIKMPRHVGGATREMPVESLDVACPPRTARTGPMAVWTGPS
jgi:hypothetical protein